MLFFFTAERQTGRDGWQGQLPVSLITRDILMVFSYLMRKEKGGEKGSCYARRAICRDIERNELTILENDIPTADHQSLRVWRDFQVRVNRWGEKGSILSLYLQFTNPFSVSNLRFHLASVIFDFVFGLVRLTLQSGKRRKSISASIKTYRPAPCYTLAPSTTRSTPPDPADSLSSR